MPDWTSMEPRDPAEEHRASTNLELFFDLTFVVAVTQASTGLHHNTNEAHYGNALLGFGVAFFVIWWAWMNFTWFASAYGTDDTLYRLMVLLQMAGALVLAAGIPRAFGERQVIVVVAAYAVMRVAMIAQWVRAAQADPERRSTALRYAGGIALIQVAWISWLALPDAAAPFVFLVLAGGELAVPLWAERAGRTTWMSPTK